VQVAQKVGGRRRQLVPTKTLTLLNQLLMPLYAGRNVVVHSYILSIVPYGVAVTNFKVRFFWKFSEHISVFLSTLSNVGTITQLWERIETTVTTDCALPS